MMNAIPTDNDALLFRPSTAADEPRVWEIILQAKEQMRQAGSLQWQDGYPNPAAISDDTANQRGYVLTLPDGKVVAYAAVCYYEEAYDHLEGEWLTNWPYVVVHRLAVANEMKHRGVAQHFFSCIERMALSKQIHSFRIDTNYDNYFMLHILEKRGFVYCGEVYYRQGSRKAFEKKMESKDNEIKSKR
jgi:GNAT superfamily N-acetyltransferase